MYEHKSQPLASQKVFFKRLKNNFMFALAVLTLGLLLGVIGYKVTVPEFDWYDSLLNASMILSGMGPVIAADIVLSNSAKVFASVYALFSGVTFLSVFSIAIAPMVHRFFHKLHLDDSEN
jgi:hypothetical protein